MGRCYYHLASAPFTVEPAKGGSFVRWFVKS